MEKKTTESTSIPHVEDQNPKTREFSPIDALEDTTGNTPETVKDHCSSEENVFYGKVGDDGRYEVEGQHS